MSDEEAVRLATAALRAPRVFFICNLYGSAGSYFFHTLFDGHPSLNTFLFDMFRVPIFVEDFDQRAPRDHVAALFDDNERLFDTAVDRSPMNTLSQLGDTRDQGIQTDRVAFRRYLELILDRVAFDMRNFTLAVTLAHRLARGIAPRGNTFVLYTHDLPRTALFQRGFAGGRILALCRHPVSTHVSRISRWFQGHLDLARDVRTGVRTALRLPQYRPSQIVYLEELYRLLPSLEGPLGVISIEELHASPRASMERVATFMDVPFHPTMLESTIGGLAWWGSHYTRVHGFSRELHRRVRAENAGAHDTAAVMMATQRLQCHLGYPSGLPRRPRAAGVRAWLPGRRYPADVVTLVRAAAGRTRSLGGRLACARLGLERLAKYLIARTVLEGVARSRIAALDARADFSKLVPLNPPQPGTIEA